MIAIICVAVFVMVTRLALLVRHVVLQSVLIGSAPGPARNLVCPATKMIAESVVNTPTALCRVALRAIGFPAQRDAKSCYGVGINVSKLSFGMI